MTEAESQSHRSELESLVELFYDDIQVLADFHSLAAQALPPVYATLLAHRGHMTMTLEAYHESLVDVHALSERSEPESYARQSSLTRRSDGAIVQYGIMRIDLAGLPQGVRREIVSQSAPLGRILIRNNLLREVELHALWRIELGQQLAQFLQHKPGETIYGRSAAIRIAGEPAVDLLEIVTDHPTV